MFEIKTYHFKDIQKTMLICPIISLIMFFTLFFGLIYPEYINSTFIPSECSIINTSIIPNYNCIKICNGCLQASYLEKNCDEQILYYNSLDPSKCLTDKSQCAKNIYCNNGYKCCNTDCDTCQSCTFDMNNVMICTYYPCNCYCSEYTKHHLCSLKCSIEYTTLILIRFKIGNKYEVGSNKLFFKNDLINAEKFIKSFKFNETFTCYYDPNFKKNNETLRSIIINDNFWDLRKSIVFVIFGILPLYICLFIYTFYIIKYLFRNDINSLYMSINFSLWNGIIIPFFIILPITQYGLVNKSMWMLCFYILIILCNIPLFIICLRYILVYIIEKYKYQEIPYAIMTE